LDDLGIVLGRYWGYCKNGIFFGEEWDENNLVG
jgi:hypothetical protein